MCKRQKSHLVWEGKWKRLDGDRSQAWAGWLKLQVEEEATSVVERTEKGGGEPFCLAELCRCLPAGVEPAACLCPDLLGLKGSKNLFGQGQICHLFL
jgi:hypothetical protein